MTRRYSDNSNVECKSPQVCFTECDILQKHYTTFYIVGEKKSSCCLWWVHSQILAHSSWKSATKSISVGLGLKKPICVLWLRPKQEAAAATLPLKKKKNTEDEEEVWETDPKKTLRRLSGKSIYILVLHAKKQSPGRYHPLLPFQKAEKFVAFQYWVHETGVPHSILGLFWVHVHLFDSVNALCALNIKCRAQKYVIWSAPPEPRSCPSD